MTPTTPEEALDQCEALWAALAKDGSLNKWDVCEEVLGYTPLSACPACEWAMERRDDAQDICCNCPIKQWRLKAREYSGRAPCLEDGPYSRWTMANPIEKVVEATQMLQLIKESRNDS